MTFAAALTRFVRTTIAAAAAGFTLLGAVAPASAQPALWVVKDADSTIYLLGTVHLLKPETKWHSDKLDKALAEAKELWLELPTTNAEAMQGEMMQLVARYGLSPATPLSKDLTPEEMKSLDEAAKLAGLSSSQLNVFRPWFAALTISTAAMTRAGYDPASGVDSKVEAIFRAREITPKGLETAEEQIKIFAGMSREQELDYLRETMEEYEDAPVELDKMVTQWASADIVGMEQMFVTEMKTEEPDLYAALLVNRNANWAVKIEEMLKGSGTIFIAVGAGHLIGPDSVLAMLKAKGIGSERVQ
jgi:uncharacterized protein